VLLLTVQREVALKGSSVSREQNNLLVVRKFMTQNGCLLVPLPPAAGSFVFV